MGTKRAQILKNPQFYSQKWPTKTATKSWLFLLYFRFIFLNFFVLFSLFLLISCCFITSWNPKTAHQMRLQAYLYIVSLVVILSNWVCDNWVYGFPSKSTLPHQFFFAIEAAALEQQIREKDDLIERLSTSVGLQTHACTSVCQWAPTGSQHFWPCYRLLRFGLNWRAWQFTVACTCATVKSPKSPLSPFSLFCPEKSPKPQPEADLKSTTFAFFRETRHI